MELRTVAVFVLCTFAVGAGWFLLSAQMKKAHSLQPIIMPEEKGWGDVQLPITQVDCSSPAKCALTAIGLHDGKQIGLRIRVTDVAPNSGASFASGSVKFSPASIVLESLGEPTRNYARLLSELYERPTEHFDVPKTITLTAVALEGDTSHLVSSASKIKVFHGEDEESDPSYFELYINPDLPRGVIGISEKDPDYRLGVLRTFGAKL